MSRFLKSARQQKRSSKQVLEADHLEVTVREGTSQTDVDAIVQALATISSFFGVKLVKGGGSSGGSPFQRILSGNKRQKNDRPFGSQREKNIPPRSPPPFSPPPLPGSGPEHRVEGIK